MCFNLYYELYMTDNVMKMYDLYTIDIPTDMYRRSLELCKAHFGLSHLKTSRCYQLWGQMYWNRYVHDKSRTDWLQTCLEK